MPIDFTLAPELEELRDQVRGYVRETALPAEDEAFASGHGPTDELRAHLHRAARHAGVFAPTVPVEWGGLGLDVRGQAVILEEAGYSLLGPVGLNAAAPDEGNMHMLDVVATPAQKQRYLAPLAAGRIRSCFAMTEPAPGAGSDPSALRTEAIRKGDGWLINGHKWFITGAAGAAFAVCMAKTSGDGADGATMFLVDADNPGLHLVRQVDSLDQGFIGGHWEVRFDDCYVDADAVLGQPGHGFRYAQVRLAPARLTHCMRWLGVARRAHDLALDRAGERQVFGSKLGELGMVQAMIADNEIDLAASRALIWQAAWVLDTGGHGRHETSVAKTFVAEAVGRIVDRAVQIHGALGVSTDAPLARLLREVRPFRIYDGPSEVHRWSIARRVLHKHGH